MKSKSIRQIVVLCLILTAFAANASAQTLFDVVASLSDRQRVTNQQIQVYAYLSKQNVQPGGTGTDLPADNPIDWLGVGTNPTQTDVDVLGIGEKISLLNQAVAEFERLKFSYINSNPGELQQGNALGSLKPYTSGDFDPLPRATPENYNKLLRLLAQRVRALRLIPWYASFRNKTYTDLTNVWEVVDYSDPEDSDGNGDRLPFVKIVTSEGTEPPATVDWAPPDSIGAGNLKQTISESTSTVNLFHKAKAWVYGHYSEEPSLEEAITSPLHSKWLQMSSSYPDEARVTATAPGAAGTQIDGTVVILHRSNWHQISSENEPSRFEKNNAGYAVDGQGNSAIIPLFGSPPSVEITGNWITTVDYTNENGRYLEKKFVEGGYLYKEAFTLPSNAAGYSNNFNNSYERHWDIGCTFYTVFKPAFTRGLDAFGMQAKLDNADSILAANDADGELLLHARPGLLFGIDLGPGLKGSGNGYISTSTKESNDYAFYANNGLFGNSDVWNSMMRFDSSYLLQFAGSCSDYHVFYENDRSQRIQSLPNDLMGWPYTDFNNVEKYDSRTLYRAWDLPRLKQVAGRDLLADIVYNSDHYGGYTVNIYRRPTGSPAPIPGKAMETVGMTLIRTWTFSHEGGSTAHPTDAEKLDVSGSGNEKYEIQSNEVLPNQGLGLGWGYWYFDNTWWMTWTGTHSWTLKLSQGTTEMLKKDIRVIVSTNENNISVSDTTVSLSQDGQEVFSLSSATLNPFSDALPKQWQIISAEKTTTGLAIFNDSTPAFGYGKWPTSLSIQYDGIQPDADYAWDPNGLLSSKIQGQWRMTGSAAGNSYSQSHEFNSSTVTTRWTEFLDGGNKVKTYTSPDGNAGSKSDSSVAWSEIEYGTAASGLPGLPRFVKNSDGSGSTYDWNASSDGSYVLTLEQGLLSGSSVSRGTKLVRQVNTRGHPIKTESFVINGGTIKTGGTAFANMTAWGMPKKATDYATGLVSTWDYNSNLTRMSTHTGYLGLTSALSDYDGLGRPTMVSANNITATRSFPGFGVKTTYSGTDIGEESESTTTRDALGRLTTSNTTWNGVTDSLALTYGPGSVDINQTSGTYGNHSAEVRQEDGTLASVSGPTLAFGGTSGNALSVSNGLLVTRSKIQNAPFTYLETHTDAWGRVRKVVKPSAAGAGSATTTVAYSNPDAALQRTRVTEPSGRRLITESDPYNSSGSIYRSGIDVDSDGTLGGVSDRYIQSITTVANGKVVTVLKQTKPLSASLREVLRSELTPSSGVTVTKINANEETITSTPNYANKTVTTISTKGWSHTTSVNNLGLATSNTLSGTGIPATALNPTWRADGSLAGVSLTIGGETHSASFNNDGTLASLFTPGRDNILDGHSISGGVETLTVDGITTTRKLDGTEASTSGGEVPGKTETLAVNGKGFKHSTTPAVGSPTNVAFNAAGAATAKNYAAGAGESYGYKNELLTSVSLARGGGIAYGYSRNGAKDLVSAVWPAVASGPFSIPLLAEGYHTDRAGGIDAVVDASGTRTFFYQNGRLASTSYTAGLLRGYQIVRTHDTSGRHTGILLKRDGASIHSTALAPNGASDQITGLASGGITATPQRDGAGRITGYVWSDGTGNSVTQSWQRGAGGRIEFAGSDVPGAPTFDYLLNPGEPTESFDARNRRLKCATAGGTWTYTYGISGQLTNATHPTLGTFTYAFDAIGRRTDMGAANTTNLLNQSTAWTNSQPKKLTLSAHPDARVWFNGTEIENFPGSHEVTLGTPGATGQWIEWNTLAVLEGQGEGAGSPPANALASPDAKAAQSGAVWIPPAQETLAYDAAGNRQGNTQWDFGWDAKNQLVRARTKNHSSAAHAYDLTFTHDAEGRRVQKHVVEYQHGAVVSEKFITFVWDGWDLLYERQQLPSGLTTIERKYLWGPDIADGASGGAGGLLLIQETKGNNTQKIIPLYDGTGHVTALTNLNKDLLASYAYGPFGEKISATGQLANSNPWRWATKYFDEETGLYYFGKRYLDPVTGQWLSRELLGESESLNLYSYCHNDPVNRVDVLGLAEIAFYDEFWHSVTKIGLYGSDGFYTRGDFRTIPRSSSEANEMHQHFNDLLSLGYRSLSARLELGVDSQNYQQRREMERLMDATLFAIGNISDQLRIYRVYCDESGNLTDEMLSDAARIKALMPQVASVDESGVSDMTLLAFPQVRALAAGEVIFDIAENEVGTGGAYAATAGALLAQMRGVKNIPLKVLVKNLGNSAAKGPDFMVGRLGGELYNAQKLQKLGGYLKKKGFKLRVDGDDIFPSHVAGGFDGPAREIILRSNPTKMEVWHELSHFRQFQKLGPEAYIQQSRTMKEQFVFDLLENSPRRWGSFTPEQRSSAVDYIYSVGGIR